MKKLLCAALAVGLLAVVTALQVGAQGTSAKVRSDGKDKIVVESGGNIEVKSGGTLTVDGTLGGSFTVDSGKISGAFAKANLGADSVDTTKLDDPAAPAAGRLLCYTNDGKIGKVTAALDTPGELDSGKVSTCQAF